MGTGRIVVMLSLHEAEGNSLRYLKIANEGSRVKDSSNEFLVGVAGN